ncbi:MAG: transposase [bacterium]|nr:transposase [bacterium]
MSMLNPPFVSGEFYHIYNRGVEKRGIFMGKRDYWRFLETLDYYRREPVPMKLSDFRRGVIKMKKIEDQKEMIRIYCFCLMPNHFHLLIQQLEDGGVTLFLRKVSDSYTRYFNTKYERVGSLFQGPFKARLIENEEYLLQLSKYIHRNPLGFRFPHGVWEGENNYYSSYRAYISGKQHPFCDIETIISYFSKTNPNLSYQAFVEETEIEDPTLYSLSIDEEV